MRSQIVDEVDSRSTSSAPLTYSPAEAKDVATAICERCMLLLRDEAADNWKIVVNCAVLPAGSATQQVSSCLWDAAVDGSVVVKWSAPGGGPLVVIVTVYGLRR